MTDTVSKKKRSEIMSAVRSKETKIEIAFRKELWENGFRYRKNPSKYFGKPDIVFKKEKLCVFLDSDFWHGWQYPHWKHLFKNDFWRDKIENNRKRDRKTTLYLRKNGWKIFRIWEHEINKDMQKAINRIVDSIN